MPMMTSVVTSSIKVKPRCSEAEVARAFIRLAKKQGAEGALPDRLTALSGRAFGRERTSDRLLGHTGHADRACEKRDRRDRARSSGLVVLHPAVRATVGDRVAAAAGSGV